MDNSEKGVIERIRQFQSQNDITIQQLSSALGFAKGTVEKYLNGPKYPKTEFFLAFSSKYGVSLQWILEGVGPVFWAKTVSSGAESYSPTTPSDDSFIQIKRYTAEASAGHGSQVSGSEGTGHYAFNQRWLDRRGLNANSLSVISVRGDSMEPDLYENDLLLLDHAQTDLKDSHIYAVQFSEGLYVKRIQHLPEGQIHLISRNTNYPPITVKHPVADGVQIIGRVVASMHEW